MGEIVFGCIVPHPPLLVPDIGRGQEEVIPATTRGMERLTDALGQKHVDAVLIISPHGGYHVDAMGILSAPFSTGDLSKWGVREPQQRFDNALNLAGLIRERAGEADIPVKSIGESGYELDHGVMVPLHFLIREIKGLPLIPLTFAWLPLQVHFAFGKAIRQAVEQSKKRVAIVASGDLSHRLIPGAPAGYDAMGEVFDKKLVEALSHMDVQAVMGLDDELIERAGECGLRSVVILLGALDGLKVKPEILSYEGPFGVGYLVASFDVI